MNTKGANYQSVALRVGVRGPNIFTKPLLRHQRPNNRVQCRADWLRAALAPAITSRT